MRKYVFLLLITALLSGCAAEDTFETVSDALIQPVMAQPRLVCVDLPGETALPVIENNNGRIYVCNDYEIVIQTVFSGDLEETMQTMSGRGPFGEELGLTSNPALFAFVGRIQEETHRFAVTYHHSLHSRRVRTSVLEQIEGVGEARRKLLMKEFGTVKAVRQASREDLCRVVPQNVAEAIYSHFHPEEGAI